MATMKHIADIYAKTVDTCMSRGLDISGIRIMYDVFIFTIPDDVTLYDVETHGDLRDWLYLADVFARQGIRGFRWSPYFSYVETDTGLRELIHTARIHYHDWRKEFNLYGMKSCISCGLQSTIDTMKASHFEISDTCMNVGQSI